MSLDDKIVLITGGSRRIGRSLALAVARAGGDVAIHYWQSQGEADSTRGEVEAMGRKAFLLQADLSDPRQAAGLIPRVLEHGRLYALVNNASVFEALTWKNTSLEDWNRHLMINLTVPFLLGQAFAQSLHQGETGRIVNLLDWRALRPGPDHLPYTISKSALAALTRSLAAALAPQISVNGLALGAVLPPGNGEADQDILKNVPARRWASLEEVGQALVFLLDGPAYITGEIIHVDGGRHLV
ncbi:MAG: SDR family oxidoreductase [Planctomycetes bacterium]|nr:SDR family oxidoreductase [Planctomycetota bacterium]